jgi:thioredoxin
MAIIVNDSNFKTDVIEKSKTLPVLVDFWATWCPPCRMLTPVVEEVSKEMKDELIVAKADTANCPKTCVDYSVQSIPALKIFKDGKLVAETVGFMPKAALIAWIKESI